MATMRAVSRRVVLMVKRRKRVLHTVAMGRRRRTAARMRVLMMVNGVVTPVVGQKGGWIHAAAWIVITLVTAAPTKILLVGSWY